MGTFASTIVAEYMTPFLATRREALLAARMEALEGVDDSWPFVAPLNSVEQKSFDSLDLRNDMLLEPAYLDVVDENRYFMLRFSIARV